MNGRENMLVLALPSWIAILLGEPIRFLASGLRLLGSGCIACETCNNSGKVTKLIEHKLK
jgi:hypothetical protein